MPFRMTATLLGRNFDSVHGFCKGKIVMQKWAAHLGMHCHHSHITWFLPDLSWRLSLKNGYWNRLVIWWPIILLRVAINSWTTDLNFPQTTSIWHPLILVFQWNVTYPICLCPMCRGRQTEAYPIFCLCGHTSVSSYAW